MYTVPWRLSPLISVALLANVTGCPAPPSGSESAQRVRSHDADAEGCETAWAWGETTLVDLGLTKKWGWVFEASGDGYEGAGTQGVYAAAGQNDISKGYLAGYLDWSVGPFWACPDNGPPYATVDLEWSGEDYGIVEAHLFVGVDEIGELDNAAPGQFDKRGRVGVVESFSDPVTWAQWSFDEASVLDGNHWSSQPVDCDAVYQIAAHFVVCPVDPPQE